MLKYLTKEDGATEQTVNLVYGGTTYTTEEVEIGETLGSVYEHIRIYEDDGTTLLVDLTDYVVTNTKATYGSCIPGNDI